MISARIWTSQWKAQESSRRPRSARTWLQWLCPSRRLKRIVPLNIWSQSLEQLQVLEVISTFFTISLKFHNNLNFLFEEYSIETVSLLWALQTDHVTSVIVGVEDLEELAECMECLKRETTLSFDEVNF